MALTEERAEEASVRRPSRGFLAKAVGVTFLLSVGGSALGLFRDLLLARLFGAGSATDAFLVSWTVPETAAPLLIEDAMAFLTVPAFSAALAARREAKQGGGDPLRALVAATLPWLALSLAAVSGAVALGAPALVHLLAPGLADPGLAVVCTRLTAITVLPFGLVGYLAAGLRAHHRFTAAGAVYIAYNLGILAVMTTLHGSLGIRAAALGVAVGSMAMVAVLLPEFSRRVCGFGSLMRRQRRRRSAEAATRLEVSPWALLPVMLFTLSRQAQVFIERYLGSSLPPGSISHLNYAEKVAQTVMIAGLMVCIVSFPVVARALAEGDAEAARSRVERDLGFAALVVLAGTVVLVACAPQLVQLLFERGQFTASDTAATAAVMRVYSLGLLGQAMVGTLVRPFLAVRPVVSFGSERRRVERSDWYPLAAMGLGLVVTAGVGTATAPHFGAVGLAAANAAGISLTAVLLLLALRARGVRVRLGTVLGGQARLLAAAVAGTGAAVAAADLAATALASLLLGTAAGLAAFTATALLLRAPELAVPLAVVRRRLRPAASV